MLLTLLLSMNAFAADAATQALSEWIEAGQVVHARPLVEIMPAGPDRALLEARLLEGEKRPALLAYERSYEKYENLDALRAWIESLRRAGALYPALSLARSKLPELAPALENEISARTLRWDNRLRWLYPAGHPLLASTRFTGLNEELSRVQSRQEESKFELSRESPAWVRIAGAKAYMERGEVDLAARLLPQPGEDASFQDWLTVAQVVTESSSLAVAQPAANRAAEIGGAERLIIDGISLNNPDRIEWDLSRGWLYLADGKIQTAEKHFQKILEQAPLLHGARQGLAVALLTDRPRAARDEFQRWVTLEPSSPDAYLGLAETYGALAQYEDAEAALSQARILAPGTTLVKDAEMKLTAETSSRAELDAYLLSFGPGDRELFLSTLYRSPLKAGLSGGTSLDSRFHAQGNSIRPFLAYKRKEGSFSAGWAWAKQGNAPWVSGTISAADGLSLALSYNALMLDLPRELLNRGGRGKSAEGSVSFRRYGWDANASWRHSRLSDGNQQRNLHLEGSALATADAGTSLRLGASADAGRNSLDAAYFSPSEDLSLQGNARYEWLSRRSRRIGLNQWLGGSVGGYWQKNFAPGITASVAYGHSWSFASRAWLSYDLSAHRAVYDGEPEYYPALALRGGIAF